MTELTHYLESLFNLPAATSIPPSDRFTVFDTATTRLDIFAIHLGVNETRRTDSDDIAIDEVLESLELQGFSIDSRAAAFAAAFRMLTTHGFLPDPVEFDPAQLSAEDDFSRVMAGAAEAYPVRDDVDVRAVLRKDYPDFSEELLDRIDAESVKLLGFVPLLCTAGEVKDLAIFQEIVRVARCV